jgi:hypothetical protein
MCIRCRENVFTEPLPRKGGVFWLHYSGFQVLGGTQTHRQQGDLINFLLFFQNAEVGQGETQSTLDTSRIVCIYYHIQERVDKGDPQTKGEDRISLF